MQRVRQLERRYRHSRTEINRQILKNECHFYSKQLAKAKQEFYSEQLDDCDVHQLFQRVDRLTSASAKKVLPSDNDPNESLADRFSDFFTDKIDDLVKSFQKLPSDNLSHISFQSTQHCFHAFSPIVRSQVQKVIRESRSTSSRRDPIPTWLLKNCVNELTPVITSIVNASLKDGHFPDSLKHAHITPILKSSKFSPDELKSYRPVSNLPFLGKIIERLVLSQFQDHLSEHNLYSEMQSGYRPHHSCETALLKVTNDILLSLDKGEEAVLLLLDYSAAFDTVSHDALLSRLHDRFGLSDTALEWFHSYLTNRTQSVVVGGSESQITSSNFGVPQGSVIGPLAFTLFSSPLEDVIKHHDIRCMTYADDTQIYLVFKKQHQSTSIQRLSACVSDIKRIPSVKLVDGPSHLDGLLVTGSDNYVCFDGFTNASAKRVCTELGFPAAKEFSVSVGFCDHPGIVPNGLWDSNITRFGSKITLACGREFVVNGSATMQCMGLPGAVDLLPCLEHFNSVLP
ncbi:uncharacterized protein [Diadema antillarum]|uniref:uncharacterized protein n=1 Tax=Diadema antillarum TaxID=105358 RepID=UPI003A8AD07D